jgi:hypothetical protein
MSLSGAVPIKFESASRVLATPKCAPGKFGSILFDRPGKAGQGIRLTAAPGTPIVSGTEATPSGYNLPKMTLKMTVSTVIQAFLYDSVSHMCRSGPDIRPR